ncbi:hypothetical protein DFP72DRAFT_1111161 [Ephemerocybe angulata]|uniref:MYND-type domain-containing protein n=1 Tax=Ephemerocybe angulata TaxID=980116 RepID=A0A8H6LT82_9AGAR|nr:hypothetical protein DFP72DRAFT_1111161 [Tulosesus angulatus]
MNTHATIRLRQNFEFFDWKARPSVCDNLNHTQSQGLPVLPGNAQIRYDKRCSGCHTAVYCSQECQTEDWNSRHRRECRGMEHDYNEYERLHTPYSYNTRTFQLAALRALYSRKAHVWAPASTPMEKGGNRPVITLDVTRWDILNRVDDLHYFIGENRTLIPKHLTKRFDELVKRFEEDVKFELGLVNGVFWFGSLDINLVVLFRRARGAPLRPGEASDFEVEGTVMFTCPRREWRKRPIQLVGFEGHAGRDENGRILEPIADLMSQLGISQEDRL